MSLPHRLAVATDHSCFRPLSVIFYFMLVVGWVIVAAGTARGGCHRSSFS